MKSKIEVCKEVLANHQYQKINYVDIDGKNRRLMLDVQTANLIVTVYEAIKQRSEANAEKLMNMSWVGIINNCNRCVA